MSNEKNVLPLQSCLEIHAIVAQLVEQRIRNAWVAGSSPASGSKQKDILYGCLFVCHLSRTRTVKGSPQICNLWGGAKESSSAPHLRSKSMSKTDQSVRVRPVAQSKKTSFMGVFLFAICHGREP